MMRSLAYSRWASDLVWTFERERCGLCEKYTEIGGAEHSRTRESIYT